MAAALPLTTCRSIASRLSIVIRCIWTLLIEKVNEALSRFPAPERPEIVFSAHSIPMSVIEKGDPYQRQIEETVRLLTERGGWSNPHRLCYQSKVGASRWLQPSLHQTLRHLADGASARNVRRPGGVCFRSRGDAGRN